jgi:hypothetical protein
MDMEWLKTVILALLFILAPGGFIAALYLIISLIKDSFNEDKESRFKTFNFENNQVGTYPSNELKSSSFMEYDKSLASFSDHELLTEYAHKWWLVKGVPKEFYFDQLIAIQNELEYRNLNYNILC